VTEDLVLLFDSSEERCSGMTLSGMFRLFYNMFDALARKFNGLFWTTPFLRWKEVYGRMVVLIESTVCHRNGGSYRIHCLP